MHSSPEDRERVLLVTAVVAASLIHISIAATQTLLGLGIGMTLLFRRKLEFPRIWLPLLVFFSLTAVSLLLSPDPRHGWPQIRKFFVYLLIPLIYSVFRRHFPKIYYVLAGWAITATASGLWGLTQFFLKYHHADVTGEDFYTAYVGARITGFESHWMTFGALQLSVLLFLLAQIFFSDKLLPKWAYLSIPVLGATVVLGWTRSIWIASLPSTLYLLWFWRPKLVWLVPAILLLIYVVAPGGTTDRLTSLVDPHGETDSNEHRLVTFRTGWQMIRSHPLFGLGPEQISSRFSSYVPSDVPRPLPIGYYGHLHNIYLQYAAERGIPALLSIMSLIGMMLWDCFRGLKELAPGRSQQRCILHGTVAFTIAILAEGLFEFNLGDSEVLMMFVTVVGVAYAALWTLQTVPDPAISAIGNLRSAPRL